MTQRIRKYEITLRCFDLKQLLQNKETVSMSFTALST